MGKFRDFLEAYIQTNLRTLSRDERFAQGRDKAEPFVKSQLALYGINITGQPSFHEDAVLKIDGYWDGSPVQIKIRTSKNSGRNDIAYELIKNYSFDMPVKEQLKDPYRAGRDFGCKAEHYFMMDQEAKFIYHIPSRHLKSVIQILVNYLDRSQLVARPFKPVTAAVAGLHQPIDVRCVADGDADLYRGRSGFKLMAFIPVAEGGLASNKYPVQDLSNKSHNRPSPTKQLPPTIHKPYQLHQPNTPYQAPDQSTPPQTSLGQ